MAQDVPAVSWSNKVVNPLVEKTAYELNVALQPSKSYAAGQVIAAVTTSANDVQTFTATGTPTGGSFTFVVTNPITGRTANLVIPYNATSTALQTLANAVWGTGNVTAGGGPWPGTALTLTGAGALANSPIPVATASTNSLTGGTSPNASVAHTTTGVTAGRYGPYASANADGTQNAEAILPRDCQTDQLGNITFSATPGQVGGEWGETRQAISAWFGGVFDVRDLVGLDANAVTKMGGRLQKGGTVLSF